jgi:hypothetical protein
MNGPGKRIFLLAITTILTLTCGAHGQEISWDLPPDTTFMLRENFGFEPFSVGPTPPFMMTPATSDLGFSEFLRQSLFQVNQPGGGPDQNLMTLQWIWRDEVARGSKYETLRDIVGAVEVGAVTYLAYRHLKRYGLK